MYMTYMFIDITIAFIIDLIVGDPYWMPHPVRFIGWLVKSCESLLRRFINKGSSKNIVRNERITGVVLMIAVVAATFFTVFFILKIAGLIHPILFHIINIYFIYSSLAARCLANEAKKVFDALLAGNLPEARKRLSMLVGRQTEQLDEKEVARGVVETTAENTVDGIVSPMIYAIAGSFFGLGAPFAYAFKAISTLDSMVGYMNKKYINFGRASAKTDDAANFLPARLSGILIPMGAFICGYGFIKSFTIMIRDRHNHKSPNCAYPEAAFAGALGIRIGGANIYFGQVVEKPTIGDKDKDIGPEDIQKAIRLMYCTSVLTLALGIGMALMLCQLLNLNTWGRFYCIFINGFVSKIQ